MNDQPIKFPEVGVVVSLANLVQPIQKVNPKLNPDEPFSYIDIGSIDNRNFKIVSPKEYVGKEAPSRARQLVQPGDILFSTVRTYLKNIAIVDYSNEKQIASTGFSVIRPNKSINNKFLFYYMLTDAFLSPLNDIQRGSNYPAVRNSDVLAQQIPVPSLAEQLRIVNKIANIRIIADTIDNNLDSLQAQIKLIPKVVLDSVIRGDVSMSWRIETGLRKEKPSEVELFPGNAKHLVRNDNLDIELGNVNSLPEGWHLVKLGAVAGLITKGTTPTSYGFSYKESGIRFIRTEHINEDGKINNDDCFIDDDANNYLKRSILSNNDILFSIAGTIGRVGFVEENTLPSNTNQALAIIRGFPHTILPRFIFYLLRSDFVQEQTRKRIVGTGRANISLADIKELILPIPPLDEQKFILKKLEKCQSLKSLVLTNAESARNNHIILWQSILNQTFTG